MAESLPMREEKWSASWCRLRLRLRLRLRRGRWCKVVQGIGAPTVPAMG